MERNRDWSFGKDQLPTENELSFFDHHAAVLVEYLAPMEPNEVDRILLPIWIMASRQTGVAEASFVREVYKNILAEQPQFALVHACRDFLTGCAGDGKWRPEPGEIFQRAEVHAKPYREELAKIRSVLKMFAPKDTAPLPPVAALVAGLVENMRMENPRKKTEFHAPLKGDAGIMLAAEYATKPPPLLSDEFRAKLGAGIPEIRE